MYFSQYKIIRKVSVFRNKKRILYASHYTNDINRLKESSFKHPEKKKNIINTPSLAFLLYK